MTFTLRRALALAVASLLVATATAQTSTQALAATETLGCYTAPEPLEVFGDSIFQTDGYCKDNCTSLDPPAAVMAIVGGQTCYCGQELPPLDTQVSSDHCDSPCVGYPLQNCGGMGYWQLYLTGLTGNVRTAPNISTTTSSTTTSGGSSSSSSAAIVTKAGETVFVTNPASSDAAQQSSSSSGPNKVGIAVGVVVGVLALAAVIGVVVFILKRKRNREIEEEHRRTAAGSFVSGKSDKSSNDQRLDPSIYTHRRPSIGSIADERDFSRRILQVRNPDRESKASAMAA